MRRRYFLKVIAGAAAAWPILAHAQTYPSRPITIVVGYAAGGPTDTIARIVAERIRGPLGQSIVVENVSGASGSIGAGRVAHATADGYTLSVGDVSTHVFNGATYSLQYDVLKDFEPIAMLPTNPSLILAKNAVPARDLRELVVWIKANQDKVTAATAGAGSPSHVSLARFQAITETNFQLVPYRGAAPAMQDVIAGRVDIMLNQTANALPQVRAGKLKAYAVTSKTRVAAAPEIPTVDEAGLPGFYFSIWRGLWAPKGTPKNVIAKLNAAVVEALADPVVRERLAVMGEEIPPREQQTPEALGAFQKAEIEKWWPIIKAANIKGE
jgi:tripartite-type tricarboxylate transporter receptor subunit TctC